MTGFNARRLLAGQPTVDLSEMPASDQQQYLSQFCDTHPDASYLRGVLDLYKLMATHQNIRV
jgi:hypothetical protein